MCLTIGESCSRTGGDGDRTETAAIKGRPAEPQSPTSCSDSSDTDTCVSSRQRDGLKTGISRAALEIQSPADVHYSNACLQVDYIFKKRGRWNYCAGNIILSPTPGQNMFWLQVHNANVPPLLPHSHFVTLS